MKNSSKKKNDPESAFCFGEILPDNSMPWSVVAILQQ